MVDSSEHLNVPLALKDSHLCVYFDVAETRPAVIASLLADEEPVYVVHAVKETQLYPSTRAQ